MSSFFSANQYEGAFNSKRLQNYEIPAEYKQRPSTRTGTTKIISNDSGHIIFENRRSSSSPWGSFVGTWQAERKPLQLRTGSYFQTANSDNKVLQDVKTERPSSDLRVITKTESPPGSRPRSMSEPGRELESPNSLQLNLSNGSRVDSVASHISSRPESRMGKSGTQSPLGSCPPTCGSSASVTDHA